MTDRRRFFVFRLSQRDFRPDPRAAYSVALAELVGRGSPLCFLDAAGVILCFFDPMKSAVDADAAFEVPPAVVEAGFRQFAGSGDDVDAEGRSFRPF